MPDATHDYVDDLTIGNDALLWRNIPHWHLVDDANRGCKPISSAAFDDPPNGTPMSVVLGDEVFASGREPSSLIVSLDGFFLASVPAGLARSINQGVSRQPLLEEPAHAVVFGKKTNSVRKRFAREATWIIGPDANGNEP